MLVLVELAIGVVVFAVALLILSVGLRVMRDDKKKESSDQGGCSKPGCKSGGCGTTNTDTKQP